MIAQWIACLAFIGLAVVARGEKPAGEEAAEEMLDLEFAGAAAEPEWIAQNDTVMGGVSKGGAAIKDGQLVFSGSVSLENNGGFASVMTRGREFDLSGAAHLALRVLGDGRAYQLRISTDARHRGGSVVYMANLPTKDGEWLEVKVPFSAFRPTHHGNDLPGPPLDLAKVEEIGLFVGDKRPGPFEMKVDWMKAE